jgi:sensor histidine kinase regulating citrate/malate metabolism
MPFVIDGMFGVQIHTYLLFAVIMIWGLAMAIFYYIGKYYIKENEAAAYRYQSEMIEKYVLRRERSDEMIRILSHDLKHQLKTWQVQVEAAGAKETVADIEAYAGRLAEYDLIDAGNETANALLNQKHYECLNAGIDLTVKGCFEPDLTLGKIDIAALTGNLLDNAYEAAVQVTDFALRKISLSISRKKHFLMIKIKNGCQHEPPKENGVYVSAKPDKMRHGLGMISIEQIINNYHGAMQAEYEAGFFTVSIMLRAYSEMGYINFKI